MSQHANPVDNIVHAVLVPVLESTRFDPKQSQLGQGLCVLAAMAVYAGIVITVAAGLVLCVVAPVMALMWLGVPWLANWLSACLGISVVLVPTLVLARFGN